MSKANKSGLHIRRGNNLNGMAVWEAWDGDCFISGAHGAMSFFLIGSFLDSLHEKRYPNSNPGIDWLLEENKV